MGPFFVLKSVSAQGQTKYAASSFRNGRPRVMAFETVADAKIALGSVSTMSRDTRVCRQDRECARIFKTNGVRLTQAFGRAEIGIDFCAANEKTGALDIRRSVLLHQASKRSVSRRSSADPTRAFDQDLARSILERDFGIEFDGRELGCPSLEM